MAIIMVGKVSPFSHPLAVFMPCYTLLVRVTVFLQQLHLQVINMKTIKLQISNFQTIKLAPSKGVKVDREVF